MRKNYAKNTVHLLLSTDRSVDCRLVTERLRKRAVSVAETALQCGTAQKQGLLSVSDSKKQGLLSVSDC
jgi:hypothetical protein